MHGLYYDPLHGHCLRKIERMSPDEYRIVGVYGDDEKPHTHNMWTATMRVIERTGEGKREVIRLRVDFAGKPIKKNRFMTAVYRDRRIKWVEDGNEWRQLFVHPRQL